MIAERHEPKSITNWYMAGRRVHPHARWPTNIDIICDIYTYPPLLKGGLGLVITPQNVTNM